MNRLEDSYRVASAAIHSQLQRQHRAAKCTPRSVPPKWKKGQTPTTATIQASSDAAAAQCPSC